MTEGRIILITNKKLIVKGGFYYVREGENGGVKTRVSFLFAFIRLINESGL